MGLALSRGGGAGVVMDIEAERFLALTAMLAGFVPTRTGAARERVPAEQALAEDADADEPGDVDGA